jgi:hypothetical protein
MNIDAHPLYKKLHELCLEIENLPASEKQTQLINAACALEKLIDLILE